MGSIYVIALDPNYQLVCFSIFWGFYFEYCLVKSWDYVSRLPGNSTLSSQLFLPNVLRNVEVAVLLPRNRPLYYFNKWLNPVSYLPMRSLI